MIDTLRLIFSAIWFPATGSLFAAALTVVVTLGDYLIPLGWILGIWVITSLGVIVTSLD